MLNATPAVLLALGPMHTIGLGSQAFGVVLMGMGVTALLTQLVVFKRLQPVIGLYKLGVVAATLFGTSAIFFFASISFTSISFG